MGQVVASKKELKIAVAGGFLYITVLQFPGKKKMAVHELMNGLIFSDNAVVY